MVNEMKQVEDDNSMKEADDSNLENVSNIKVGQIDRKTIDRVNILWQIHNLLFLRNLKVILSR